MERYVAPRFGSKAFNCAHCGVLAQHKSRKLLTDEGGHYESTEISMTMCTNCGKFILWDQQTQIYPFISNAPVPSPDMPDDVKEDFLEARNIHGISNKAAAALLRLAIKKLLVHLGEKGQNINTDINNLAQKGLAVNIQRALKTVRVTGEKSIIPGQIDSLDTEESAKQLFHLLNLLVDVMITQPRMVDEIFYTEFDETKEEKKTPPSKNKNNNS